MDAFTSKEGDIPDSTDWLNTPLVGLMQVEQAFRCHVCKDFFNSPMITSCNHTFCSLCIRRCLSIDGKCPLCRAGDQEMKLRGNWALREAVDAFCKARVAVLTVARLPVPVVETPTSPKRKASGDELEHGLDRKRPRTSTRLSKQKGADATAAMAREEADVPEGNDAMDYEPDDGLAACPICWERMKEQLVDKHIDTSCPGAPQPKSQQRSAAGPSQPRGFGILTSREAPTANNSRTPERLPMINYSILNDSALRKKMSQLGISANGPRQLLQRRHQEYVTLWNANCDSAQPKKKGELLQDLQTWERTVGGQASTLSRSANHGAQIKDKDFDGAAWAAQHDASFKDLIATARASRLKATQKPLEQNASSESTQAVGLPPISSSGAEFVQPSSGRSEWVDLTSPASIPSPDDSFGGFLTQRVYRANSSSEQVAPLISRSPERGDQNRPW